METPKEEYEAAIENREATEGKDTPIHTTSDVMVIYLYRRDVDAILDTAPPKDSPLYNELNDTQQNLIDALENAEVWDD